MTTRNDLTAELAAAIFNQLTINNSDRAYHDIISDLRLLERGLRTARQEALRDVLSDLDSLHWKDHWYASQLRKKINDRLASEGG